MNDFDSFVRKHTGDLLRTAYLIVWDQQEAEDVVQETLLTISRKWRRVESMEFPLAYARQILVNRALRSKRRRGRRDDHTLDDRDVEQYTGDLAALTAEHLDLQSALANLTRDQRAIVTLRYFNGFSELQIASILDCPPGTVKSRCARALAHLREQLAPAADTTPPLANRATPPTGATDLEVTQ